MSPPSSGPTAQQQALSAEQAVTNANLNLQENEQRKVILNAMQGTRVFRGSALSRQTATDREGTGTPMAPPGISGSQQNAPLSAARAGTSLLDEQTGAVGSGTVSGAGGGAGGAAGGGGGRAGGGGKGGFK